ncbi:MAG: hypothetical protein J3K34DRAFT_434155 [Monoraphidium minutum]|nr:MAG: hypothetical protein J3K34DRAFT_434155 [Monoraphidium minutum]
MLGGHHLVKWTVCVILLAACCPGVTSETPPPGSAFPQNVNLRCSVFQTDISKTPFALQTVSNKTFTVARGRKNLVYQQTCFFLTFEAVRDVGGTPKTCSAAGYQVSDCCVPAPYTVSNFYLATAPACSGRPSISSYRKSFWSTNPDATKRQNSDVRATINSNVWRVRFNRKNTLATTRRLCFNIFVDTKNVCPNLKAACGGKDTCDSTIGSSKYTVTGNTRKQDCCVYQSVNATDGLPPPPPTGNVGPGQFWNGPAAVPCPPGSFSVGNRSVATDPAGAGMCTSCSSLVSFRELNAQAGKVESLQSTGAGGSTATCTCPSNTFFASQGTSSYACAGCPMGTTSGATGATAVASCNANCVQGYYGTPGQFGYGSCTICPTVSPGNAPSSTPSTLPTPVPVTLCTEASAGSYKNDSSVPAVAFDCDGNKADSGDGLCSLCKIGFFGGSCDPCPAKYPSNPVRTAMPPQTDSESAACGPGCAAGLYGGTCDSVCQPADVGTLKTPTGEAPTSVGGAAWVTPSLPSNSVANCVWGCPPGTGYAVATKTCVACTGSQYSAGATPYDGTNIFSAWPVCTPCPSGTVVATGQARCVTPVAAPVTTATSTASLFDDFE